MKTKLLFQKKKTSFFTSRKFKLFCGCLFFIMMQSNAQEVASFSPMTIVENVVPNVNATTNGGNSFLGPLTSSARTYQLLIAESQLTSLVGKYLISVAFRSTSSTTSDWPTAATTYNNYDIYLSGSVNPADRSFVFAQNVVGTQTQVRSGSLSIPVNSLSYGSSPNNFSFDISFTTPWLYSGGNLLVEIRHDGSSGSSKSVDAAGTSSSGYGTLYSACWGSSYTATSTTTQGNFAVVNFKAEDTLKTSTFESVNILVYPNPATDVLYINSEIAITKIKIFNLLGQLVLNQEFNNTAIEISMDQLNSGTYLVQVENELGTEIRKIVKK